MKEQVEGGLGEPEECGIRRRRNEEQYWERKRRCALRALARLLSVWLASGGGGCGGGGGGNMATAWRSWIDTEDARALICTPAHTSGVPSEGQESAEHERWWLCYLWSHPPSHNPDRSAGAPPPILDPLDEGHTGVSWAFGYWSKIGAAAVRWKLSLQVKLAHPQVNKWGEFLIRDLIKICQFLLFSLLASASCHFLS